MGIINVIDSTIARNVHCGVYMNIGKEVSVASTKSFTSSLLILKLFSLWLLQSKTNQNNSIIKNIVVNSIEDIKKMNYQIKKINNEINLIIENININKLKFEHIYILGKGTLEYIAKETSLKLKEICYIHGEGMSSSELKHGPLALIQHSFPVILLINEENYEKMLNTYNELYSRNAYIFIITTIKDINIKIDKTIKNHDIIVIPSNKNCEDILFMIVLQYLCYNLAIYKKINPDKPRNLAKVVTVE